MSTISEIEDRLTEAIKGIEDFKLVGSLGRRNKPAAMTYPSAFVYFLSDMNTETQPRPVYELTFEVMVITKNLLSEASAAKDAYELIDAVREEINGKALGLADIETFSCVSREIAGFEDGIITYALRFQTRHYLDVPVE
jgi:hypothetical protein